jgi:hypothetical protein
VSDPRKVLVMVRNSLLRLEHTLEGKPEARQAMDDLFSLNMMFAPAGLRGSIEEIDRAIEQIDANREAQLQILFELQDLSRTVKDVTSEVARRHEEDPFEDLVEVSPDVDDHEAWFGGSS